MIPTFFAREADDRWIHLASATDPDNPFLVVTYLHAQRALGRESWLLGIGTESMVESAALCFMERGRVRRSLIVPSSPPVDTKSEFWPGLDGFCRKHGITDLDISTFATPASVIPAMRGETTRVRRTEYAMSLAGSDLWEKVSKSHRDRIKKGRKNGLVVRREATDAAIDAHVSLHMNSMDRRKLRGEDVSLEFERSTSAALLTSGAAQLFQAMLGDHVASSLLVLRSSKGAYSESSGNSTEGMNIGASHFLRYEAAVALQTEGIEMFYLGGAREHEEGLRAYKAGFGTIPIDTDAVTAYIGGSLRRGLSSAMETLHALTKTGGAR
ncbi:MAG: GNAT family N-acetyltransferase [Gemmatimonadaceae bacterium]|nr:GNAT family N-acetyltransferase [Gemmatimonadaceae bacterium]